MRAMKMQVVFRKGERLRHIGHLDLMRAMQRALRRSGLPVKYSQGFNPHILLSFAAPLAVGIAGEREVMEVPLDTPVSTEDFLNKLNAVLPPELACVAARQVDDLHPAPMAALFAAAYLIVPAENAEAFQAAAAEFLARDRYMATHRTKSGEKQIDLRPLVFNLVAKPEGLHAVLSLNQSGTCKPDLLIAALSDVKQIPVPACRVTRTRLLNNLLVPLENA